MSQKEVFFAIDLSKDGEIDDIHEIYDAGDVAKYVRDGLDVIHYPSLERVIRVDVILTTESDEEENDERDEATKPDNERRRERESICRRWPCCYARSPEA